MSDSRLDVLFRHGIEGQDAVAALATYDACGGMEQAVRTLSTAFGSDAARAALVLLKHG